MTVLVKASPFVVISFHPNAFDRAPSFAGHTSSPLFSAIIAWERSPPLIPSACQITIAQRSVEKCVCVCVCALSVGGGDELVHLWKTNRLFRYDLSIILAQDMNSSVILIASEGEVEGTGGAERHVLRMASCLAAGILRSAPSLPVQGPLSPLLALICRHRPLLQAHHRAAERTPPPPPAASTSPLLPPNKDVNTHRASSEAGRRLCCLLPHRNEAIRDFRTAKTTTTTTNPPPERNATAQLRSSRSAITPAWKYAKTSVNNSHVLNLCK